MLVNGRPTVTFVLGLAVLITVLIGTAFLARSLPSYGLNITSKAGGPLIVDQLAGFHGPWQLVRVENPETGAAIELTGQNDAVRRGERMITAEAIAHQNVLAQFAAVAKLRFTLRDSIGRETPVVRARRPTTLGWPFWTAAVAGMVGALAALWILVLRPGDPAARAIAATGLALCVAALPFAVLQNGELIVGGSLWRLLVTLNWFGAHVFGTSLIAYFTWFPRPVATSRARRLGVTALALVALLMLPLAQSGSIDYEAISLLVSADFLIIVTLVTLQWRRSRGHPLARAALRLVGSATVITLSLFLLVTYLPPLLGASAEWADPLAFVLMLPPFIAIAVGVTRGWMFDLDRWAWRLIASALSLFLIVAVDVVLLVATKLAPDTATTAAVVGGAALWVVSRQQFLERLFGRARRDGAGLLARSGEIALGMTEAERFQRWRGALDVWFRPLSISPSDHIGPAQLEDAGISMLVAAPPFGTALQLYAANQGRSLFSMGDVYLVDALSRLCEQTDAARQAYDRGMHAERERIARDLHDDVGGRLVTSLHRESLLDTQSDVRRAIREMRQLLTGLRGDARHVSDLVATCRTEVSDRLDAAGVMLRWPMSPLKQDPLVEYSVFRAVEATLREAMTNVVRHASALIVSVDVSVTLSDNGPMLAVQVDDNGSGIKSRHPGGSGLTNMRKRIAEVGGTLKICSSLGTQIVIQIPLSARH